MANPQMILIASSTLGANASSYTFSSIPQIYTDLLLKVSSRIDYTGAGDYFKVEFNGTTTGNTEKYLYGSGSGTGSFSGSLIESNLSSGGATANTFGNCEIYISNYTSGTNKTVSIDTVYENNATAAQQALVGGLWSNTAAITSIKLTPEGAGTNNFVTYSSFYLYGITRQ